MKTMMKYVRMAGVDIADATQNLNLLPPKNAMTKVVPLKATSGSSGNT